MSFGNDAWMTWPARLAGLMLSGAWHVVQVTLRHPSIFSRTPLAISLRFASQAGLSEKSVVASEIRSRIPDVICV